MTGQDNSALIERLEDGNIRDRRELSLMRIEAAKALTAAQARCEALEADLDMIGETFRSWKKTLEIERDAAWNEAIEAAAVLTRNDACRFDTPDRIRALKKGKPT